MILMPLPISTKFDYSTNLWRSFFVDIACFVKRCIVCTILYVQLKAPRYLSTFNQYLIVVLKAFKNKMYGSNYAWIIFGEISTSQFFPKDSILKEHVECTSKQLKEAADRYISTIKLDIRQDNHKTLSGMVSH